MIAVAVVTPVRLFRDGLAQALAGIDTIDDVSTAAGVRDLAGRVEGDFAGIVLIDLAASRNLESIAFVRGVVPNASIVGLGVIENEAEVLACIEAGLVGYVSREGTFQDLADTIEAVARGEMLCSPKVAATLVRRLAVLAVEHSSDPAATRLTLREREIVELIDRGLSNKEIASRLRIELATVKKHVHNVLAKLELHRRLDVADWARRQKLGSPSAERVP